MLRAPEGRAHDAELKILEELLASTNRRSNGRVVIYTERRPCPDCRDAIDTFKKKRPGIKIDVEWDYEEGDRIIHGQD